MLRAWRRDEGQDLVEMALVLPMIIAIFVGILEFSVMVFSYNTLANAAREGARYGVIHPTDTAGIQATARTLTEGMNPAALTFVITRPGGNTIRVEATYNAPLITGILIEAAGGSSTVSLRTVSTMRIE